MASASLPICTVILVAGVAAQDGRNGMFCVLRRPDAPLYAHANLAKDASVSTGSPSSTEFSLNVPCLGSGRP